MFGNVHQRGGCLFGLSAMNSLRSNLRASRKLRLYFLEFVSPFG